MLLNAWFHCLVIMAFNYLNVTVPVDLSHNAGNFDILLDISFRLISDSMVYNTCILSRPPHAVLIKCYGPFDPNVVHCCFARF